MAASAAPVLVVAALSALLLAGCSGSDSASQSDVESTLLAFEAPAEGWVPADLVGNPDSERWALLDNGLWQRDDETVTYFAAKVTLADSDRVCDEAAAWVSGATDVLPGEPDGRSKDWMAKACHQAFDRAKAGEWGPVTHIGGVGVVDGGLRYGAGITVLTTDAQRSVVQVAASAQPES